MGIWDSISQGASDIWDGGAKYVEPIAEEGVNAGVELFTDNPVISLAKAGYDGVAGAYDAATGDDKGAVEHASSAALELTESIPGVGTALSYIDTAWGLGAGAVHANDPDSNPPMLDEAIGDGANHVLGTDKDDGPHSTSISQGIGAGLGTLAMLPFGPLAWMGGAALGHKLGIGAPTLQSSGIDMTAIMATAQHYAE